MSRLPLLKHMTWLAAAALLAFSQLSTASPIECGINDTHDATANGAYADDCHFAAGLAGGYGDSNVLAHLNALSWADDGMFSYIGRYEDGGGFKSPEAPNYDPGFTLTVGPSSNGYEYSYQLAVPESWVGTKVDWVLGVKQADNSYMSYLFEGVVLGIDGGFNNFWASPGGNPNKEPNIKQEYSFAAGFIREVATVPEAGTFLLMLTGLLGLGFARRQTRQSA